MTPERRLWLIYRAWTNSGPVPGYHRWMQDLVRRSMPILARLLDEMYRNPPKETRQ